MTEHLLALSLHGELRRGHGYSPQRHTIDSKAASNLIQAGLAEVAYRQPRKNKPAGRHDIDWIRLSAHGRRRLAWLLKRKL